MQTTRYITNGVLVGLHHHKVGQYRNLQRVTCLSVGLLVLVLAASFLSMGDGGTKASVVIYRHPAFDRLAGALPSPASKPTNRSDLFVRSKFPIGYVGEVGFLVSPECLVLPTVEPPGQAVFEDFPVFPGVPEFVGRTGGPFNLCTDCDFGLPEPLPLWTFTSRYLPPPGSPEKIRAAQAIFVNPSWPERAFLTDDTAVVDGWLTLHSYGLMSFELVSETPANRGFGTAVEQAVERGRCVPARDFRDNRITVRLRYRCLFFHGGAAAVNVTASVNAKIR